jgi:hypothetical protein
MKIDTEKIQRYLMEIKARHHEIKELLSRSSDAELLTYRIRYPPAVLVIP